MKTPRPRLLSLFTFHFSLFTAALCAATPSSIYTLTPDGSTLRAFLPADPDSPDVSTLDWTNPPPALDLSSIALWNVRRPWPLTAVDRLPTGALRFTLAAPLSVHRPPSVTASLPALRAAPRYLLSLRDDATADLAARIDLSAPDPALLPPPSATLHYRDTPTPRPPAPRPGAAGLNLASPIADYWFPPAASRPPRLYPLPGPLDPASSPPSAQLATLENAPFGVVHLADNLPAPLARPLPVRLLLSVAHPPLPPGPVDLPSTPSAGVITDHVPADAPIPIDFDYPSLAAIPPVLATRHTPEETPIPGGGLEIRCRFDFQPSDTSSPASVQILERPPYPDWTLTRSSSPAQPSPPGTLRFDLTIPPEGATFTYTLRLSTP